MGEQQGRARAPTACTPARPARRDRVRHSGASRLVMVFVSGFAEKAPSDRPCSQSRESLRSQEVLTLPRKTVVIFKRKTAHDGRPVQKKFKKCVGKVWISCSKSSCLYTRYTSSNTSSSALECLSPCCLINTTLNYAMYAKSTVHFVLLNS